VRQSYFVGNGIGLIASTETRHSREIKIGIAPIVKRLRSSDQRDEYTDAGEQEAHHASHKNHI
jgi:hypothetical protein